MKDNHELFKEYYEKNGLEQNSIFSKYSKEELIIEADHLRHSLVNLLEYLDDGGTDLKIIYGKVMDGLYESRI